MQTAVIYFSDASSIQVQEGDKITPIIYFNKQDNNGHAAKSIPNSLCLHLNDGLIPSIMDSLCHCDFFYLNNKNDTAYGTHTITKIELI